MKKRLLIAASVLLALTTIAFALYLANCNETREEKRLLAAAWSAHVESAKYEMDEHTPLALEADYNARNAALLDQSRDLHAQAMAVGTARESVKLHARQAWTFLFPITFLLWLVALLWPPNLLAAPKSTPSA